MITIKGGDYYGTWRTLVKAHNRDTDESRCRYVRNYSDAAETQFKQDIQNLWGLAADIVYSSKAVAPNPQIQEI